MPMHTRSAVRPSALAATIALSLLAGLPLGCASNSTPTIAAQGIDAPSGPVAIISDQHAPVPQIPMGDPATVRRILDEGRNRNQVMKHLSKLTNELGPRLTGSTRLYNANLWCKEQYTAWGLTNSHIEQWGEIATRFDRGPSSGKLVVRREKKSDDGKTETSYDTVRDFEFSTLSWTRGTDGPVRGPIVREPQNEEEYTAVKDKLKGAWVIVKAPAPVGMRGLGRGLGDSFSRRIDARDQVAKGKKVEEMDFRDRMVFDGVAGWISTSRDERVWTTSTPKWRERKVDDIPPDIHVMIRGSDYDAINSRLADAEPIEIEFNLQHTLTAGPIPTYNTIAEIRGTEKPDEVVVISAHLDSWDGPGSQGTLDNGTGSSVTLEAARLLMAAGAKPKRTIRFINWTGEEQGLLGSKGYVEKHKDELPKISAVFVDDGGTNYEGGLGAATQMIPMLAAATAPVNYQFFSPTDHAAYLAKKAAAKPADPKPADAKPAEPKPEGVTGRGFLNVNIRDVGPRIRGGGGSDHASFNAVGVPGFFWDEVGRSDYGYGWHTQHDKYDLAIEEYLTQSSTCVAVTAYNLACAPDLLPRSEPEKKEEAKPEGGTSTPPANRPTGRPASQSGA